MIRLIVIRIFESVFRNFYIIIAPLIFVPLIAVAIQLVKDPSYLSGATVQIRYNYEISKVIGYEKFGTSPKDPSERMVWELQELLQTDAFADKVLANVNFENSWGVSQISNSPSVQREFLRDNVQLQPTGIRQVAILAYMPTEESAVQVINSIYDEYLNHQITTIGGSGRDLVNFMNIYLDAKTDQKNSVQQELEAYLASHPEDASFDRREIEQTQISLMTAILDDLVGDIEYTKDILDLGLLLESTSERYFRETFLLLDAPFQPISMTTITKKVSNVIQSVAIGFVLSIMTMGAFVIFDRRITLPLDLSNTTELPLLTMVPMENAQQKQRYQIRARSRGYYQRLVIRIKKWVLATDQPQPKSRKKRPANRDLNTLRR